MTSQKEIIENIRRGKSETSPENIKTMNSLLKIVSDDIYSKNVHLVRFPNPYKLWQEEHLTIQSLCIRI